MKRLPDPELELMMIIWEMDSSVTRYWGLGINKCMGVTFPIFMADHPESAFELQFFLRPQPRSGSYPPRQSLSRQFLSFY